MSVGQVAADPVVIGELEALEKRDYPIVTAVNLLMAAFVLVVNVLIDISYAWLDPRIRYD